MATRTKRGKAAKTPATAVSEVHAPSAQEITELVVVDAPVFSVSGVQVQASGNDFILTFTRPRPMRTKTGEFAQFAFGEPVAILTMSPQTAKDLATILAGSVERHESDWGEITSPFLLRHVQSGRKKAH